MALSTAPAAMTVSPPADFAYQWALAPAGTDLPTGDGSLALETQSLVWFQPLPVARVYDGEGRLIGALLGHAVDYEAGVVVKDALHLPECAGATAIDALVEQHIYGLSGSWAFVLDIAGARRLYLDADGSLSAVYDPAQGRAAATAGLLLAPRDYAARFRQTLYDHLDILREGWFPAGLTAHEGITRVLVNHYLDLETWTQHRHWPTGQIPVTDDPSAACLRVAEVTRKTIDALRREGPIAQTLTAGNETRLLLACCRDIAPEIEFVTVSGPETRLDTHLAGELAQSFALTHRLLPIVRADAAGQAEWHARTGHCVGGINMSMHPSVTVLRDRAGLIVGASGEVGRGFYWRPNDTAYALVTGALLERRLGMRSHREVRAAIETWLRSVADLDAYLQLDLAYIELRMGPWAFPQCYSAPEVQNVAPMISREAFAAMLSLPPQWRRDNALILHTIERLWPELLDFPINSYGDYRDVLRKAGKAIRNPHLVAKKLRKMRG